MLCNGSCCARFPLPISLQVLKRWAQEGKEVNGTVEETKMLAEMLIPLTKKAEVRGDTRYFYYTCKNFNAQTRRCMVYEKRPSLCRTYPDNTLCSNGISGGCEMTCGTDVEEARREFRKSHGVEWVTLRATDGNYYDYPKDWKKRKEYNGCLKQCSTSTTRPAS